MKTKAIVLMLVALILSLIVGAVSAQDGSRRFDFDVVRELTGIVTEATGLTPQEIRQAVNDGSTLAEVITENGGNVDDVTTQIMTIIQERVAEAQENEVITEERATQILENLETRVSALLNGEFGNREGRGGRGPGNEGFGQWLERGIIGELTDILTEMTGLTQQELRQQIADGSTVAEIVEANGGDVDAVIAQAMESLTAHINDALENGHINEGQANGLLESLEERVTNWVNNTPQGRANGGRGNNPQARRLVQLVADATGLEAQDVVTQVQAGSSLATILTDNGVDVNSFIAEQSAILQERLNTQMENGLISQEVADARLALFQAQMNDWLNRTIETE